MRIRSADSVFFLVFLFSVPLVVSRPVNGFGAEKHVAMNEALKYGERVRASWPARVAFDRQKTNDKPGLRTLRGKHLVLFTDLPGSPRVDELPEVFDAAVPQWAEFFHVDPDLLHQWKMIGVLVADERRFASTDLLAEVPRLRHGYSVGHFLWLREQKSGYYRRHLLLHEGVHGFMNHFFGTCGPDWYMEGLAEYLGTHLWDHRTRTLRIGWYPQNARNVPAWERIRLVREEIESGRGRSLNSVMTKMAFTEADDTHAYAWSWAAAAFLNRHPAYAEVLRESAREIRRRTLTPDVSAKLETIRPGRCYEYDWLDFLANLQYDYDFARTRIAPIVPAKSDRDETNDAPKRLTGQCVVPADRGWCVTEIRLKKGKTYRFASHGRVQIAREPQEDGTGKIWWSEPNGVTIRYHHGKPLGLLLGTIVPDRFPEEKTEFFDPNNPFFAPVGIGKGTTWTCNDSGTLYLRINDSVSELEGNRGTYTLRVSEEQKPE